MTWQIVIVALGAALAGFVQGLSGFAFGLVAMSVWAWTLEPVLAGPLIVFGSLIGQLMASGSMLKNMDMKRAWPLVVGGLAGVPLGVALLRYIDPRMFKTGVGLLLLVWCPCMLFARNLPRIGVGGVWADACAGWLGGVMGGLGGLTGPAPILWTTLRGWERRTQRGVFQVFNLTMHSVTMTVYLATGTVPKTAIPLFAAMLPAMLIPTYAGIKLYHRISDLTFSRVVLSVLTAAGAILIVTSQVR